MTDDQLKQVFQRDSTQPFAKSESHHSAWAYNRKGALLLFSDGPKFLLNAETDDTLQTAIDNARLVNVDDTIIYQPNAKKNKAIVDIAAKTVKDQFLNMYDRDSGLTPEVLDNVMNSNDDPDSDSDSNFGLTPEMLDNGINSNDDPPDSRTSSSSND